LLHAVAFYENKEYCPETLILRQATSPFRTAQHLQEALALYNATCEMVVSVKETKSNPYYVLR
jgi:N-acylneuraminate cytidylyltransferase